MLSLEVGTGPLCRRIILCDISPAAANSDQAKLSIGFPQAVSELLFPVSPEHLVPCLCIFFVVSSRTESPRVHRAARCRRGEVQANARRPNLSPPEPLGWKLGFLHRLSFHISEACSTPSFTKRRRVSSWHEAIRSRMTTDSKARCVRCIEHSAETRIDSPSFGVC
jgi:hypothetical protein